MNSSEIKVKQASTYRQILTLAFVAFATTFPNSVIADDSKTHDELKAVKIARSGEPVVRDTPSLDLVSSPTFEAPMLDPNPTIPKVLLSEGHKKTCLKRVGDELGDVTLRDINGESIELNDELSDQLTVLVFWTQESVSGYEQFRRIPVDILGKFAAYRVKVVAVNVGGTVEETKRLTGKAGDKIVSLVDSDSKMFNQFATEHIPRTYVLDKDGRIAWFDLEYSEGSRRSLTNALTYFVHQAAAEKP